MAKGMSTSVLVVDDEQIVRRMLELAIRDDGRLRLVGEAASGRQAVAVAQAVKPDAVILDHEMPELTGLQSIPCLRRSAPHAVIVVYASRGSTLDSERAALDAGADAYVEKADRVSTLLDTVVDLVAPSVDARRSGPGVGPRHPRLLCPLHLEARHRRRGRPS